MAEFVVGSDGTLGNLPRRKAKSVRQYAAKEDWKRQKTKEVGCKLDRIASVFQEAAQCCGGIPPRVACQHVFARPQPPVRRGGGGKPPPGRHIAARVRPPPPRRVPSLVIPGESPRPSRMYETTSNKPTAGRVSGNT